MTLRPLFAPLSSVSADLIIAFTFQDKEPFRSHRDGMEALFGDAAVTAYGAGDFSGKDGESLFFYTNKKKSPRVCVLGLGDSTKFSLEKLRRASASAAKKARATKVSRAAIVLPDTSLVLEEPVSSVAQAMAEGILLSLYKYDKYITKEKSKTTLSEVAIVSSSKFTKEITAGVNDGIIIAEATIQARDLSNAPGSEIYPQTLAAEVQKTGRKLGYRVTVLDKKKIASLGMGGVIGVSKGSEKDPRFIILEHGKQFKKNGTVALVGKGVTFDTGGISIKPAAGMAEMKMDMGGAAAVIGTFHAIARLKLKRHVVGLIPSVENMPSGSAIKPGDILRHYNGKTSEVDNTDAEGRLILADALSYATTFKPDVVIDLATLTGACVVALGHYASGMMGNDDATMDALRLSGDRTYDRVWPLPMYDEYEKLIRSDVADVKNVGGRWAGAITAGWFLKKFIGDYKWVHLDIAGTAMQEENQDYIPRGGSGAGVRLLVDFLKNY